MPEWDERATHLAFADVILAEWRDAVGDEARRYALQSVAILDPNSRGELCFWLGTMVGVDESLAMLTDLHHAFRRHDERYKPCP